MTAHRGGTGRDYLLSRIEAQDPALADRARRGMITVFRAATDLGIVGERFTIMVTSADKVAATLTRKLSPEMLHELIGILVHEETQRQWGDDPS